MPHCSILAEPIPGPDHRQIVGAGEAAGHRAGRVAVREARARASITTPRSILDADGALLGHLSQDAHPGRSALLREILFHAGRSRLPAFDTSFGAVGTLVCWDQWYPEGARLTALHGARSVFYPTAIGWHPAEKAEFGAAQHDAWERSSARTPSPTASTSRRSIASATRGDIRERGAGRTRVLGRIVSSAIRSAG